MTPTARWFSPLLLGIALPLAVAPAVGTPDSAAHDGPVRLVAAGDARPALWIRQIEFLTVLDAP